jgi:hypothetical protein
VSGRVWACLGPLLAQFGMSIGAKYSSLGRPERYVVENGQVLGLFFLGLTAKTWSVRAVHAPTSLATLVSSWAPCSGACHFGMAFGRLLGNVCLTFVLLRCHISATTYVSTYSSDTYSKNHQHINTGSPSTSSRRSASKSGPKMKPNVFPKGPKLFPT